MCSSTEKSKQHSSLLFLFQPSLSVQQLQSTFHCYHLAPENNISHSSASNITIWWVGTVLCFTPNISLRILQTCYTSDDASTHIILEETYKTFRWCDHHIFWS
jgi:hypothetical protein